MAGIVQFIHLKRHCSHDLYFLRLKRRNCVLKPPEECCFFYSGHVNNRFVDVWEPWR